MPHVVDSAFGRLVFGCFRRARGMAKLANSTSKGNIGLGAVGFVGRGILWNRSEIHADGKLRSIRSAPGHPKKVGKCGRGKRFGFRTWESMAERRCWELTKQKRKTLHLTRPRDELGTPFMVDVAGHFGPPQTAVSITRGSRALPVKPRHWTFSKEARISLS